MRNTHTIDAANQPLGRLASRVAGLLIGKVKRTYLPNLDGGDSVIIINLRQVRFTGNKLQKNVYKYATGYPGGLRRVSWEKTFAENPEQLFIRAVRRMLPKNRLQPGRIKRLKFK